ncbi:MAG: metallophosphoesterase [Defluviitaleaceae bacterium]|nr:metallophosphoesterase [Defluviitaleaceae bacterium]MCL2263092.1 metallophosphoesterase [Defluviitaleaceae bacterium]
MMKRKSKRELKKFIAMLLTLVMVFNTTLLPVSAAEELRGANAAEEITPIFTTSPGAFYVAPPVVQPPQAEEVVIPFSSTTSSAVLWDGAIVPDGSTALVTFRRTEVILPPDYTDPPRFYANETGGVFNDGAVLTAWDSNQLRAIGANGARTPMVMENGGNIDFAPWARDWKAAPVTGIRYASAFQLQFETTGFSDLRFSASMKCSGSFSQNTTPIFALAYSLDGDTWAKIADSSVTVVRADANTYEVLAPAFLNFELPAAMEDQDEVFLRVFFNAAENAPRDGNVSINRIVVSSGDICTGEINFSVPGAFLIWDYGRFRAPIAGNLWPATEGTPTEIAASDLSFFYADGTRATLGRAAEDRLAINVPNNAGRWVPTDTSDIHANNTSGWVITLSTLEREDIHFSARQSSSGNGPSRFGLAYRIGDSGTWTSFGDRYTDWERVTVQGDGTGMPELPGVTFHNVPLPAATFNQSLVQIKAYVATMERRSDGALTLDPTGGNTSINNIVFSEGQIGDGANKTALNDAIYEAEGKNSAGYSLATWVALINALQAAIAVRANEGASQGDVDSATEELNTAIGDLDAIDGTGILSRLIQPNPRAEVSFPRDPWISYFPATSGVFQDRATLTAWDANTRVLIGTVGTTTRGPVVLNNGSRVTAAWYSSAIVGYNNASGFQLTLPTTGFENLRFTASQKVSASFGPAPPGDRVPFLLAFSDNQGVHWTSIVDSEVGVLKRDDNTFNSMLGDEVQTFNNFLLPERLDDQNEIWLRVIFAGPENFTGGGNMSINLISIIGDEIGGGGTDVELMGLTEYGIETPTGTLAPAHFEERYEDAFMSATGGQADSNFRLTAFSGGEQRLVGYAGVPATPVAFMEEQTGGTWVAANGNIANATAFQFQLRTTGYVDLRFSASQKSSLGGPDSFALAYSLNGEDWTSIANSQRTVAQTDGTAFADLEASFEDFALPAAMFNRETVFLRVYFDGDGDGGYTSINNIEFSGEPVARANGFEPEMLNLHVGATTSQINVTWHDYTSLVNPASDSVVRFAPASAMDGDNFPANAITVVAERMDAYTRRTAFQATVTGLSLGTEYVYAVSHDGITFSERFSYTTPLPGDFSFIVFGDSHVGDPSVSPVASESGNGGMLEYFYRYGVTTREGWQDAIDVMMYRMPHAGFILSTGDNIDRNLIGMDPEPNLDPHQIKWYNFFAPGIFRNIPIATTMGNHEARSNISFRTHFNLPNEIVRTGDDMLPTGASAISQVENENRANFFYLYNNALFVSLNTGPRPRDANYNPIQDAMIRDIVASFDDVLTLARETHAGEYQWLFVKTHKSPSGIGKHGADFDIERYVQQGLESLMVRHGVHAYFSGHDHCYTRSLPAQICEGPDRFGPDVARADFRMNNVTFDYTNNGNEITACAGTVFFTNNSATGQKFYGAFTPEYWNNENFPYLYDGTRGAAHLTRENSSWLPSGTDWLPANFEGFGPRLPWNVAAYHQEYKPMFLEVDVTDYAISIRAVQFDHSIDPANPVIEVVDTLTITKCGYDCENCHPTLVSPKLTVSSVSAPQGGQATVNVSIANNPGFATMVMKIEFHEDLELLGFELACDCDRNTEACDFCRAFDAPDNLQTFPNHVFMGWTKGTEDITDDGVLFNLTFRVCNDATVGAVLPITVTFYNAYVGGGSDIPQNADGDELDITIVNGQISVTGQRVGDLNGDGRITSADATHLARYLVSRTPGSFNPLFDINCDGYVDMLDLLRLSRTLVGHFPRLCPHPVGECPRCN